MKKRIISLLFILLIATFTACNNTNNLENISETTNIINATDTTDEISSFEINKNALTVHFVDVGQGDCTLLQCNGENMLIDAGENDLGTKIKAYLDKQGVDSLKYVIGTHNDSDHIGSLDVILYNYNCDVVILSKKANDTKTYRDVLDICENKNYNITYPETGTTYFLGDAKITIISDPDYGAANTNDSSISLLVEYGNNTFLFTGDSEEPAEVNLIQSGYLKDIDVYQVGHHGSKTATTEKFLSIINPEFAVISCGKGNDYGHPHKEILNRLKLNNTQLFRTDEQGTVIAASNGEFITWNVDATDNWNSGEEFARISNSTEENTNEFVQKTYVLNKNTKKFHLENCDSVSKISENNKEIVIDSKEDLINQGYSPCKSCNP